MPERCGNPQCGADLTRAGAVLFWDGHGGRQTGRLARSDDAELLGPGAFVPDVPPVEPVAWGIRPTWATAYDCAACGAALAEGCRTELCGRDEAGSVAAETAKAKAVPSEVAEVVDELLRAEVVFQFDGSMDSSERSG